MAHKILLLTATPPPYLPPISVKCLFLLLYSTLQLSYVSVKRTGKTFRKLRVWTIDRNFPLLMRHFIHSFS